MNSIGSFVGLRVMHGLLSDCTAQLIESLGRQAPTAFAPLVTLDFEHLVEDAAGFIAEFFDHARQSVEVKALYFEMNEFDINPDVWYFLGFGYINEGDIWNLDWLAHWQTETQEMLELPGMEVVQAAYAEHASPEQPLYIQIARELSTYLITCRFMELIDAAYQLACFERPKLRELAVLSTSHGFDTVHRTGGALR